MYLQTRANKYFNIPTEYKGRQYASKLEASYAQELDLRKKAREITSWEAQIKLPLKVYGHLICNYIIDFIVYYTYCISRRNLRGGMHLRVR